MQSAKFPLTFLHLLAIIECVLILYQLNKLTGFRTTSLVVARITTKAAMGFLMWNAIMSATCYLLIDGLPISPAGVVLWPALVIMAGLMLFILYSVIRDDAEVKIVQPRRDRGKTTPHSQLAHRGA